MGDEADGRGNNPVKREPVALGGLLVLLIQIGARRLDLPLSEDEAAVLAHALSALVFVVVRSRVMPVATVKAAGLSPAAVVERAEDPAVLPFRGP